MSFNTQEQEIIKYGATNGKTRQEVEQAITNLRSGIIPAKPGAQEQSITQDIVGDFKGIGEGILKTSEQRAGNILEIKSGLDSGQKSPASAIFQTAGQLAGAGADAIGETFKGVVKLALTPKGEARTKELVSSFGEKVVERPETQKLIKWYEGLTPETQDNLDAVGGFASLAAEFVGLGAGQKGAILAKEGVSTGLDIAKQGAGEMVEETFKLGKNLVPKSPDIMNRVARLTPTQARKFKSLAGESHGDYLTRTGNFGTPDKIVETEAIKFSQSIKSVDDTLATLPGVYKDGVIDDVLEGLTERVALTSSKNVPSPMASKVAKLTAKNAEDGLTMGDINEMKRLYEREVKLGYNKMLNPDKVQMATNIDNALREWQVAKAEELGFTNLKELNKQTQISRNIINSLGDQVVGKTGLNNVTLTDWIMLSGGDPTAIAGFLTKKFFGSKGVQSKIAEMLSDIKPAEGIIKPKVTPSKQTPPLLPRKVLKRPSPNTTPKSTFNNPTVGQTVDNSAKEAVAKGLTEDKLPFPTPRTMNELASNAKSVYGESPKISSALDLIGRYKKGELNAEHIWGVLSSNKSPFSPAQSNTIYEALGIDPMGGFPFKKLPYKISTEKLNQKIKDNLFKDKYGFGLTDNEIKKLGISSDDITKMLESPKAPKPSSAQQAIKDGLTEEQFVKGQGTTLYHGTNQDFNAFSNASRGNSTKMGSAKRGTFFTDSPTEAKSYADFADSNLVANEKAFNKEVNRLTKLQAEAERKAQTTRNPSDWKKSEDLTQQLEDFYLDETRDNVVKNTKVIEAYADLKNPMVYDFAGAGAKDSTSGGISELIKQARKNGNDGLIMKNIVDDPGKSGIPTTHTVVFDSKNIKTTSQLRTEYQKALKATKK